MFFLLFGDQISDMTDFMTFIAFSNNQVLQIRVSFIENTKNPVFSFSSLSENSFVSSSISKTNLPATAIILNRKRRKKPSSFNAGKDRNRDVKERNDTRKSDIRKISYSDPEWSQPRSQTLSSLPPFGRNEGGRGEREPGNDVGMKWGMESTGGLVPIKTLSSM